jgi:tetratricopeptide (TPR) repeat protein/bacterioferritin (cytochrome b1)
MSAAKVRSRPAGARVFAQAQPGARFRTWAGTWTLAAGTTLLLGAGVARADRIGDANKKLADLEQKTNALGADFRESQPVDPNAADRRVLDAETLFALGNYAEAATLCLDVIEKYPQSRAYDDAIFLLGESLYHDKDLLSARRYFEQAVQKKTGSRKEQAALQRLVEIALRTGDFENVEAHLERLARIPSAQLEPSVPYVRGKYLYFREKLDEAAAAFASVPPTNPYHLQSRYFIATVQVKKGDQAAAVTAFDDVLKAQPKDDNDKEIQDLARLAIGRLLYERGQFDKAKEWYASVPRQSKYFGDAMYESTWNSIKAGDFKSAYRALDLMLLQNPDSPQSPELRLLMGNLHLRMDNFYLASNQFTQTLQEYEPLYKDLHGRLKQSEADPKYFDDLIGKGLDKFDIASIFPKGAISLVTAEPDVARLMALVEEVSELQRGIRESEQIVERLERAMTSGIKVGIFPDLAASRTRSTEILNQTVDLRRRFQADARNLAQSYLSPEDKAALDQIGAERKVLDDELKDLPLTQDALKDRAFAVSGKFTDLDKTASELNVHIQAMEAELVAIEQYYIYSRAEQKIRAEELKQPVADLRTEIAEARALLEKLRNEIVEAGQEAAIAGTAGVGERAATVRLTELLKREQEILERARSAMSGRAQQEMSAYLSILRRADGIQSRLLDFDRRVDQMADKRLVSVKEQIAAEKTNLEAVSGKLAAVLTEGQSVGGGLAQAMLTKVTDRFYDLTVQSDVGLIDVSWGLKDTRTKKLSELINQQKLELKALDDDFRSLLEEEAE